MKLKVGNQEFSGNHVAIVSVSWTEVHRNTCSYCGHTKIIYDYKVTVRTYKEVVEHGEMGLPFWRLRHSDTEVKVSQEEGERILQGFCAGIKGAE